MSKLDHKIPPGLIFVISALLAWLLARCTPGMQGAALYRFSATAILELLGGGFCTGGVISFKRANTTLNPMTPGRVSRLVTSGIYQYTRNPMYLGLLFSLLGWSAFLENLFSLLPAMGFVLYLNKYQISHEERALEALFGEEFLAYKKKVRRWL